MNLKSQFDKDFENVFLNENEFAEKITSNSENFLAIFTKYEDRGMGIVSFTIQTTYLLSIEDTIERENGERYSVRDVFEKRKIKKYDLERI